MEGSSAFLRRARYFSDEGKFRCELFENIGFYYGIQNKTTFRLIAIAVVEGEQGNGVGASMICRLIEFCEREKLKAITFRTHKNGRALAFWKKMGAKIIGEKGDDYEMAMTLED